MLKTINKISQLNFSELMSVYVEGNAENGAEFYPHLSKENQIREAEMDFYRYLHDVFFQIDHAFYAVWEVNRHYLAALRMEPYRDGWLLTALETAPDERGKGYATNLINSVKNDLLVSGNVKIYSHVSRRNIPSLSVHRKCGFHKIFDYAVYLDGSVRHTSDTLLCEITKGET